ncbi:MAG: dienelactone hydrolase family protein [Gemmatimonadota bacterium]|nr:dienelactone hydrolase family protein [Gemmatimonadota bacterium]
MKSRPIRFSLSVVALAVAATSAACARSTSSAAGGHVHPDESRAGETSAGAAAAVTTQGTALPAGASDVVARLASSPRHAEWVMVRTGNDSVRTWVVYPERRERAPVVVVIHEIFGLTSWIRGVADQLAADGFIAIAPDLLTGKTTTHPDSANSDARDVIRTLNPDDIHRQLAAVGQYGMRLPAALPRYGVVGFCWGGSVSFQHAVRSPAGFGAAVVYYGSSPENLGTLASIRVPVLGLYGSDDVRVNPTVPPADSAMRALGKSFAHHTYEGAGHGFLRAQDGKGGANLAATRQAWPATLAFFRRHLGP